MHQFYLIITMYMITYQNRTGEIMGKTIMRR